MLLQLSTERISSEKQLRMAKGGTGTFKTVLHWKQSAIEPKAGFGTMKVINGHGLSLMHY